jgi:acyl-CoA synthetase (AMP-forming)/AMP-acid ligase II
MYQPARARRRPGAPGLPPRDGVDSLVALLRWRALTWPDAPLYRWCDDEGGETTRTFAEVDARARAIAGALQALAQPGDRALLLYAPGLEYIDPSTRQRAPIHATGEVWLRGPNVAAGYWGRPDETAETFGARLPGDDEAWLRTGDLGFVHEGELFITGRRKDLIIIRGRNLAPQDIERTVEGVSAALRPGCGVAFGVDEGADAGADAAPVERSGGGEALVVVHELDETRAVDPAALAAQIVRAVGDAHDVTRLFLSGPEALPLAVAASGPRRAKLGRPVTPPRQRAPRYDCPSAPPSPARRRRRTTTASSNAPTSTAPSVAHVRAGRRATSSKIVGPT